VYRADDALASPSPDPLRALTVYEYDVPPANPSCVYSASSPSYSTALDASYTRYRVASSPLALSELGAVHDRLIDVDVWCVLVGAAGAPGADD